MSRATSKRLDKLNAPMMAWLIDNHYCRDDGGMLALTSFGQHYIADGYRAASMATMGHKEVPVPAMREPRERL